jgi:hypothetical protein
MKRRLHQKAPAQSIAKARANGVFKAEINISIGLPFGGRAKGIEAVDIAKKVGCLRVQADRKASAGTWRFSDAWVLWAQGNGSIVREEMMAKKS